MLSAWLKTFAALVCIAGSFVSNVSANPASMAMHARKNTSKESFSIWPWSKKSDAAPTPQLGPVTAPARPTEHVSPTKHPIQYFKAAIAEMPIGSKKKDQSAPRGASPAALEKADAISLNTPTGPPTPEFFIYAAQICEQQHDVPQARANLQRALTMWPGHVEVLRAAARMEDRLGNLPLAENLYQQAVTSNPQHAGALNDLGLCLARQGKLDRSVQVLEQAALIQPTKALYRNNAATVLVELRQDQRALAHLAAVHGSAEASYNLGQLLVERTRANDAVPYFQAALQQNPNLLAAQEALARIQGTPIQVSVPQVASAPITPVAPEATGPVAPVAQPVAPQPAWSPEYGFPATAQGPALGTSSSTTPRYLPPVATRPAPARR